jgi:uncharacterized membrane protein YfhO
MLGQWQFPGQTVMLNAQEVVTQTAADGRIQIDLPAGEHEIAISYQKGIPFKLGAALTCISVLFIVGSPVVHLYRKKES